MWIASLYFPSQSITTRRERGTRDRILAQASRSPYCSSVVNSKMKIAASADDDIRRSSGTPTVSRRTEEHDLVPQGLCDARVVEHVLGAAAVFKNVMDEHQPHQPLLSHSATIRTSSCRRTA